MRRARREEVSGGSYDYLHCKDPGEKTQRIVEQIDRLLSDLDRAVVANEADVWETIDGKRRHKGYRHLTDIERIAVDVARSRLKRFAEKAKPILEEASSLDDILHAIEWFASCDYGPSSVVARCMGVLEKQIGMALKVDAADAGWKVGT
jgi:hypothetical protein